MTGPLSSSNLVEMNALEAHDREQALRLTPPEKMAQALEVMRGTSS
jgi:hypothetical protein